MGTGLTGGSLSLEAKGTEHLVPSTIYPSDHPIHSQNFSQPESELVRNQTITNPNPLTQIILEPIQWLKTLSNELTPTIVIGIILIYTLSHGFSGSYFKVVTDFYWKDVQAVQPSAVQFYSGLYLVPWILKPLWGMFTDVFPLRGYHRRPYFIIAGVIGSLSAVAVAGINGLPAVAAISCLVLLKAGMAIGEVTMDACVARKSIEVTKWAADMQSLCGVCASLGALVGYLASGLFVHKFGAQEALWLLALPPAAMVVLGGLIYEVKTSRENANQNKVISQKLSGAMGDMWITMRRPQVWKPSLYIYLSLALSINTHEGQFYWYTNPKAGPNFSQEFVGVIHAMGAMASIVGVLIYHKYLKDLPFRTVLFSIQLLYGISGMLDVIFIRRWNLQLGIPDSFFVVLEECVSRIITRARWTPMMVLSVKLCPSGVEGMFFGLLMCIDSIGGLSSTWGGGVVLHMFGVSRTDFSNLWLVILVRNGLRLATLGFIFLVPAGDMFDPGTDIVSNSGLESSVVDVDGDDDGNDVGKNIELVPFIESESNKLVY